MVRCNIGQSHNTFQLDIFCFTGRIWTHKLSGILCHHLWCHRHVWWLVTILGEAYLLFCFLFLFFGSRFSYWQIVYFVLWTVWAWHIRVSSKSFRVKATCAAKFSTSNRGEAKSLHNHVEILGCSLDFLRMHQSSQGWHNSCIVTTQCPAVFYEQRGWWKKKPLIVVTRLAEEKRKLLVLYQAFLHIRRDCCFYWSKKCMCNWSMQWSPLFV